MKYRNPATTVDVVALHGNNIVLIQRKKPPFKGYWALPGGYLNYGTESLEEAAVRELAEETGIVVNVNQISLLGCCSDPHRDPRQHTITHVYLLNIPDDDFDIFMKSMLYSSNSEVLYVNIFPLDKLPRKIAFDHRKIITDMYGNPE